jgi:hypothetical protein
MLVFLPELLQAKKEHEREKACRLLCCWPTVDNDEQYQHNQRRQKMVTLLDLAAGRFGIILLKVIAFI